MSEPVKEQSFEEIAERVEKIAERLESGEPKLEEALRLFEEGVRLVKDGNERLDRAERRIERLLEGDAVGDLEATTGNSQQPPEPLSSPQAEDPAT